MSKYHENLQKLPQTHPSVYKDLTKVLFRQKKIPKAFSRIPVDLSSEQAINADAAS